MAIGRNSKTVPVSATVARPVLAPNRRSLEIQRDNSLDQVSYLQDARRRATDYLKCLAADVEPIAIRMREHRRVMELEIGRPLRHEETVHHINGVRSDNRIENLELWSSSHPSGQRVRDKIAWAKEILSLYEGG